MNPAQIKAQIDAAAAQAYERGVKDGAQTALNTARSFMPTALANAHKQGVMDTAGFLFNLLSVGESVLDVEDVCNNLCKTGELPETEKTTQGGVGPTQRVQTRFYAGPEGNPDAIRVEPAAAPWSQVKWHNEVHGPPRA